MLSCWPLACWCICSACQGWSGWQPCPLEFKPASVPSRCHLRSCSGCVLYLALNGPSLVIPPSWGAAVPAHCVTWSYCLLLSEPAGLTPAHGCSPAQVLPPLFPCREAGDTGMSVLQVRDNQSAALIHRASPSSLKAISLSVLDLPIVVNQYCLFLIIFLSFWCLEVFSLRSCLIIFTGTEVKL